MSKIEQNYLIKLNVGWKNYEETSAAKYKGILELLANEHGVILSWNLTFQEVWIDLYATEDWFEEKTKLFKLREILFNDLGDNFKQISRNGNRNLHYLKKLDKEQLEIINKFINDRTKYDSTIKSIIGVLKGSNPGGANKNPEKDEVIIIDQTNDKPNFIMLIDNLVIQKTENYFVQNNDLKEYSNEDVTNAEELDIRDFFQLNEKIKKAFTLILYKVQVVKRN